MNNKKEIILVGGGGHCKACIDVIELENSFNIKGIVDLPEKRGEKILNYEIIASDNEIPELSKYFKFFFITLGHINSPIRRIEIFNILKSYHRTIPLIISPRAYVSKHSMIKNGTIVMHDAIINASAKIGQNCIINTKALIEHDSTIGDHSHISTGAIINGNVTIGNNTFYGSGSVCKQGINIPENSFIKANSITK